MPVMAVGATEKGRTLLIALTKQDIMRLISGEPIVGDLARATGVEGLDLLMYLGDTVESIKEDIASSADTIDLQPNETAEDLSKMLEEDRIKKKH